MSNLALDIENMIIDGYYFEEIAQKLEVPMSWVSEVAKQMDQAAEDAMIDAEARFNY
jgi:cytidylate kinase